MVSPVSGGIQQQIPAANTFQPGGDSESARRAEENKVEDSTKSSRSEAARAAPPEVRNNGRTQVSEDSTSRSQDRGTINASASRGSTLDISV